MKCRFRRKGRTREREAELQKKKLSLNRSPTVTVAIAIAICRHVHFHLVGHLIRIRFVPLAVNFLAIFLVHIRHSVLTNEMMWLGAELCGPPGIVNRSEIKLKRTPETINQLNLHVINFRVHGCAMIPQIWSGMRRD